MEIVSGSLRRAAVGRCSEKRRRPPYNCRAGHCGTCCVRLVSGEVRGGMKAPSRASFTPVSAGSPAMWSSSGASLQVFAPSKAYFELSVSVSHEVMEVGIRMDRALPLSCRAIRAGGFDGYPKRPFSITHPLRGNPNSRHDLVFTSGAWEGGGMSPRHWASASSLVIG